MIDINCDMGEGTGNEALLLPFIHSANIACGYHAGNNETMEQVIQLCLQHNVHIGAHPSYPDRENFGRTTMQISGEEVYQLVTVQLQKINTIAKINGSKLYHVKPHGALYNTAAKNVETAKAIARAVKDFDASLIYFGLSGSVMTDEASKLGLKVFNEVFADRTYQKDGSLTPRDQPNALLIDNVAVQSQVKKIIQDNKVIAVSGEEINLKADTICIHGDGEHAVEFAKIIYQTVHEE